MNIIGKAVGPYEDATTPKLEELGWTRVWFSPIIDEEKVDWMRENFVNVDKEVRWLETICISFRREDEAMAFKLRWI